MNTVIRHKDARYIYWHGRRWQQSPASGRVCVLGMIFLVAGRLGRLDTRKRIFRRGKLLDNFPQPLGGRRSIKKKKNVVALLYLRPKLCQVEHAQATKFWPEIQESDDITAWFADAGTTERLWEIV